MIQLAENEITSGNNRLTIKDAVLTQQQLEAFKKAAGDYQITGYFDIKLAQILYKNTAANLWVNNIETLKKTAKVSLQIEADWESENSELAVIHEKKDGTYEIIPASFDVATKMVMFQTDGFSNYAIAYKKVETTTEDQTGATTEDPSGCNRSFNRRNNRTGNRDHNRRDNRSYDGRFFRGHNNRPYRRWNRQHDTEW